MEGVSKNHHTKYKRTRQCASVVFESNLLESR